MCLRSVVVNGGLEHIHLLYLPFISQILAPYPKPITKFLFILRSLVIFLHYRSLLSAYEFPENYIFTLPSNVEKRFILYL
jgi:uncharacterized protein YhhL (DUF1145 family)